MVPAEKKPSASHNKKNETQIVPRLRKNPVDLNLNRSPALGSLPTAFSFHSTRF
jgi:hypothetical protein